MGLPSHSKGAGGKRGPLLSSLSSFLSLSDEEAMSRVRGRDDPRAFALLLRRWELPIQRLCTRMTGDPRLAEDLAQEAFARLFAHRKRYRGSARFSTFLWRIAVNVCLDERRKAKRRAQTSLDCDDGRGAVSVETLAGPEALPDALAVRLERAELVREALLQLSERHRTVLVLRHYEGLKFREIAEVLDIPQGTVKSRMAEGLSRLARLLKPTLGEDSSQKREETEGPHRKELR